jgi:hypothetical protein
MLRSTPIPLLGLPAMAAVLVLSLPFAGVVRIISSRRPRLRQFPCRLLDVVLGLAPQLHSHFISFFDLQPDPLVFQHEFFELLFGVLGLDFQLYLYFLQFFKAVQQIVVLRVNSVLLGYSCGVVPLASLSFLVHGLDLSLEKFSFRVHLASLKL